MSAAAHFRMVGIDTVQQGIDVRRVTTHLAWEWNSDSGPNVEIVRLAPDESAIVAELLESALPIRLGEESDREMVERVLSTGPLSTLQAEAPFSAKLAEKLMPKSVRDALIIACQHGVRPVVRLMPAQSLAQVPWELLPMEVESGHGETVIAQAARLIEIADIVYGVSDGIHESRSSSPRERSGPDISTCYIVDPWTSVEGRVIVQSSGPLHTRVRASKVSPPVGHSVTRQDLSRILCGDSPPDHLVYVGHVAHAGKGPGSTGLLLSDSEFVYGRGALVVRSTAGESNTATRPLTAADLIEGSLGLDRYVPELEIAEGKIRADLQAPWGGALGVDERAGATIWPMPPRVAIIACDSGGDLRDVEPFGLATAVINAGAEAVVATKWALLTDAGVNSVTANADHPLTRLALMADDALREEDVFLAVCEIQRTLLTHWRSGSSASVANPLFWAALTCYDGRVRQTTPHGTDDSA